MSLLLVFVPALLVVVLGYVVGYAVWGWLDGPVDAVLGTSLSTASPEPAAWSTGLVLLAAVLWLVRRRWRRRRSAPPRPAGRPRRP